jgi:hypothetical protein
MEKPPSWRGKTPERRLLPARLCGSWVLGGVRVFIHIQAGSLGLFPLLISLSPRGEWGITVLEQQRPPSTNPLLRLSPRGGGKGRLTGGLLFKNLQAHALISNQTGSKATGRQDFWYFFSGRVEFTLIGSFDVTLVDYASAMA